MAILIAGCFVYRSFFSQTKNLFQEIKIIFSDKKQEELNSAQEIRMELHEALMGGANKAELAYNEKFATLLTVLTIFGIAWSLIITLLQFKFNEKEMDKIPEALLKAEHANARADETFFD